MSPSIIATLLSGLVIPGAGHLYLKHKRRGVLLIATVLCAFAAIVFKASQSAVTIIEKIQQEGGQVTNQRVIELATQASHQDTSTIVTLAAFVLFISWLFGMFDAYRLGKTPSSQ